MSRSRRGRRRRTRDEVMQILRQSHVVDANGCHLWTGPLMREGYGRFTWICDEGYTVRGAHRLAYHLFVVPVPREKVIDHLCRNRACINPAHMEPVRQQENTFRSPIALGTINAAKTHCAQGHPFSPENTYILRPRPGRMTTERRCRACHNAYHRRRYAERRGAAVAS